jgi:hypothetical protein
MGTVGFLFINEQFLSGLEPHKGHTPNAAAKNPRKSQIQAKRAIYGWKLIKNLLPQDVCHLLFLFGFEFYKKLFQILGVVKYRFLNAVVIKPNRRLIKFHILSG